MSLEIYTTIASIKESQNKKIDLVKNEIDGLLYVHKQLNKYNKDIYQKIKNINNPNIIKVYEVIEDNHILHVIEEYINAPTLEEYILNNEMDDDSQKDIILQICNAVILLHDHQIIHRDIKPENIFIMKGQAILFDFDISRYYQPNQEKDTTILGSVGYAAPEQFGFKQTDERTDVYALGVLINYIYTKHLPNELLYKGPLSEVIKKATQIDPNQRYPSVQELKNAIIKNKKSSWALPGFRSGVLKNEIIACIGYAFLIASIYFTPYEGVERGSYQEWVNNIIVFLFIFIIIAYFSNYRDINRYSFFHHSQYKIIRNIGKICSLVVAELLFLLIASLFL